MEHYKTLSDLIKAYHDMPYPGYIYIEGIKKYDLLNAEYWVMPSKEGKDQLRIKTAFGEVPESLVPFMVSTFLDVGTFRSIIENKLDHNPKLSLDDQATFLEAIKYYLEKDDFLD